MKGSILKGFAGLGARFALLSLILGAAGPAYAGQSGAPPPSTRAVAPAAAPETAAPAAKSATPAGQAVAAGEPAVRGNQEGIKIHGHWTIEVKNPDGKLVTHREFENSLAPGSGASLLAALLGGVASSGSWLLQIKDLATDTTHPGNTIMMAQANSWANNYCADESTQGGLCSGTPLSITAPAFNASGPSFTGTTLTLAGSATVPGSFTAASIGYVETDNFPCSGSSSPQACVVTASPLFGFQFAPPFTEKNLGDGNGDPAAVPVTANQVVNVTVVISFQ